MFKLRNSLIMTVSVSFLLCGCSYFVALPKPDGPPPMPEVGSVLLSLINGYEEKTLPKIDYQDTSMKTLSSLGTPMGIQLYLRYRNLSIPLVEALKSSRDRVLMERLFDLAKWSRDVDVRSASLVTLGSFSSPKDLPYFEMALQEKDVAIRAAAIEALELWGLKEAHPLLKKASNDSWSPLLQVLAIKALLAQGDMSGLDVLVDNLTNGSWVIRAMSARYLGEYGPGSLDRTLLSAFNRDRNSFAMAEMAVATLKLIAKKELVSKQKKASAVPRFSEDRDVSYWVSDDQSIEMEPLVLVPPRFQYEELALAAPVNQRLLDLLKDGLRADLTPTDEGDSQLQDLYRLKTPFGVSLIMRYSNLSVVVAESLGGTNDPFLRSELIRAAETSRNSLTRAVSLISLAYNGNKEDLRVISQSLVSADPVVRFGAMEAALIGRFDDLTPELINIAGNDPVAAFQIFSAHILFNFENGFGRHFILTNLKNKDWVARSMAIWYLGRYGQGQNFSDALNQLPGEENPFVKADIILAMQRLNPK